MDLLNLKIGDVITFSYTNLNGTISIHNVKVKAFSFGKIEGYTKKQMFLIGHDFDNAKECSFATKKIEDLTVIPEPPTAPNSNAEFGKMLKEFRIKAGMTQEDMAKHLFLPQTTISKMENGNRTIMFDEFLKWVTVTKQNATAVENLFGKEIAEKTLKQLKELFMITEEADDQ